MACCAPASAGFCIAAATQADCDAAVACQWLNSVRGAMCTAKHPITAQHIAAGVSPLTFTCDMVVSKGFCVSVAKLGAPCSWQAGTCTNSGVASCGTKLDSMQCTKVNSSAPSDCFWDGHACLKTCTTGSWPTCLLTQPAPEPEPEPEPASSSCIDRIQNGDETDVDCGGSCASCGSSPPPRTSCIDRIQNGDETDVDCGGSCSACPPARTSCSDRIQNGDERGVDCG
eukprot:COSAG01_NODE_11451_length_1930_cov_58.784271_4_plen_227_part_01